MILAKLNRSSTIKSDGGIQNCCYTYKCTNIFFLLCVCFVFKYFVKAEIPQSTNRFNIYYSSFVKYYNNIKITIDTI